MEEEFRNRTSFCKGFHEVEVEGGLFLGTPKHLK
jgi:hypothetical protein